MVGAEKLREPVAHGVQGEVRRSTLLEGYGCTEMSPVVAVNVPDVDDGGEHQRGSRAGTVGHPLPGVVAKVVDPDTGEGPLFEQRRPAAGQRARTGWLGYLGEPEQTARGRCATAGT